MSGVQESTPEVSRVLRATREKVWEVLADGWLYPLWVVGASRMREVDDTWPAPGSRLHHSVGSWPLLIDDTTQVRACEPGESLRLEARAWPTGSAEVLLRLESQGTDTLVRMQEDALSGPSRVVPSVVREAGLLPRNREALRRLALVCENR